MKKTLLGIAAVAAIIATTPALAADMPLKAPPPAPAPACVWCGWYIGVDGGGGWENTHWTYPTDNFYTTAAGQGFGTNPNGGLFGGHIGINAQVGPTQWIVGAELTGDWANLQQTLLGPVTPTYPLDSYKTQLNDLETFTLRFGYAPGNWLWYGKAGVATGSVALNVISGAPVAGEAYSNTTRLWGPTAGVGVEYMWASHFVIGVEYDYAALQRETINATAVCTAAATCGTTTFPVTINSGTFGISTLVGRLSYKF